MSQSNHRFHSTYVDIITSGDSRSKAVSIFDNLQINFYRSNSYPPSMLCNCDDFIVNNIYPSEIFIGSTKIGSG